MSCSSISTAAPTIDLQDATRMLQYAFDERVSGQTGSRGDSAPQGVRVSGDRRLDSVLGTDLSFLEPKHAGRELYVSPNGWGASIKFDPRGVSHVYDIGDAGADLASGMPTDASREQVSGARLTGSRSVKLPNPRSVKLPNPRSVKLPNQCPSRASVSPPGQAINPFHVGDQ